MRIVFFGSDDFAAVHLEQLLAAKHQVLCCVTSPDKPQGRGMKLSITPIKQMALDKNIPCMQPMTLIHPHVVEALKSYQADLFVVVAYGRLLSQEVLNIPTMICVNVHGSLLPQYRGAAPVNRAILNGDKETGVTVQKMALALDAGDIIAQEKMSISDDEDAAQLRQRMAEVGAKLLVKVLAQSPDGKFPLTPQDAAKVTYAPKLTKEMGAIDWKKPARLIMDQVRGLKPWPGTYTSFNGKMLKIIRAQMPAENTEKSSSGQVVEVSRDGILVACGDRAILITEVQPEAGRVMTAQSFAAGYKISAGQSLSS
jgi:methionyl-tRNA formyltransferase